jgi:hypothetical protein
MIAHAKAAKVGKGAQKKGVERLRISGSARWRCCGSWG